MERSHNLHIELEPLRVIKSSGGDNKRLNQRIKIEYLSLSLANSYLPDKVPEVFDFISDKDGTKIVMERMKPAKNVSFDKVAGLIEELQTLPIDACIPTYKSHDYLKNADIKLKFLMQQGSFIGLSKREVDRLKQVYVMFLPYLEPYKTVFVHGDVQARHFAVKTGGLAIFDFDQAHFGNELEDWAFLSIRHPSFSGKILSYLREKFKDNPEQLAYFKPAFLLMQVDKTLHGYFSRTYQWRGKPFDIGAKIYARNKLRSLVSKAEVVS